jgi:hypothetical protein
MPRWSVAVAALVVAGIHPNVARAQAPASPRDSAVMRLRTGQQIRLSVTGLGRLAGRAGVPAGDSLDLAQDDAVRRISISAVDSLWVRGGSGVAGAIVGGAVLGVLGALATTAAAGACEYDCGSTGAQLLGGFVIGAAVGVPLGALIGGRFPKWKRAFP